MLVSALHPILDMFTSGGLGIGLFIPFNNERLFFPDRPIKVSPIGLQSFFSGRGITVLKSELRIVILPSIALFFTVFLMRRIFIRQD
jgi:inner membrane protein